MLEQNIAEEEISVNLRRDFKGIWIPREIWLVKGLSPNEKNLWAEINSLHDREKGGCYASNNYLMQFMGVKERRLQEMISNLKAYGLIEQVSFDGRERVIKAITPPEGFIVCKPEVQKSAGQRCSKVHPSGAVKCTPPIYREQRIDISINTPPIPPQKTADKSDMPAKAGEKKAKPSLEIPEEVKSLGDVLISALRLVKPDYKPPKVLLQFWTSLEHMIRIDGRDPLKIAELFRWAVGDSFWCDKMFKPNPAKYLREKFDQLEMKMNAKPAYDSNEALNRRQKSGMATPGDFEKETYRRKHISGHD